MEFICIEMYLFTSGSTVQLESFAGLGVSSFSLHSTVVQNSGHLAANFPTRELEHYIFPNHDDRQCC